MGKYPQTILETFNEYFRMPLIFVFGCLIGVYLVYQTAKALRESLSTSSKNRVISYVLNFTEAMAVLAVCALSGFLAGFSSTIFITVVSLVITLAYMLRFPLANFICGKLSMIRKEVNKGDLIKVDEDAGKVKALNHTKIEISLSPEHHIKIPFFKLFLYEFKNYSNEPLMKVPISIEADRNVKEDTIHEALKQTLSNSYCIEKFEYPEKKFTGISDKQIIEINLWTYSDFYWHIHNEIVPVIKDTITSLQEVKAAQLKIAR